MQPVYFHTVVRNMEHTLAQLVEALRYKPESRVFDYQ
jgi:hypothetical protein